MKRPKTLLILGGTLVVLCGAVAVVKGVEKHIDTINTVDEEIVAVDSSAANKVTWTLDGTTLTFTKEDGTWKDADDDYFPVNQDTMQEFLDYFSSVHASFIIDDVEDYGQYGLDDPEGTITITGGVTTGAVENSETEETSEEAEETADEAEETTDEAEETADDSTVTIKFGDFSKMDSKRYVEIGDGKVYLIDDDLLSYVSSNRDDYMQQAELNTYEQVEDFDVSGDYTMNIKYLEDEDPCYTTAYDYYMEDGSDYKPLSTSLTNTYLNNIVYGDFTDYVTYTASAADLSQFGLDDPSITIQITGQAYKDEEESTDDAEEEALDEDDKADTEEASDTVYIGTSGEDHYLRIGDSEIIYLLDSDTYDALTEATYDTLRPTEVLNPDWDKVNSIAFTSGTDAYTVEVTHSDKTSEDSSENASQAAKETNTYTLNGEDIDMDDVISAIEDMEINTFNDESPSGSLELTLTLKQDNTDYPEVKISVYQYDGDDCLVQFNGETLGLMSRDQMADLREAMTSSALNVGKEDEEDSESK